MLVDSSWLRLRSTGRYDMHELVRQYCVEKLETEHRNSDLVSMLPRYAEDTVITMPRCCESP